ncbi:MAG: diphthine--ammonia ligase [Candidatus Bathyarchaeota archaeon]|nr:diphthine--ammonia ligase [Candidatus Termiticorpusculum sp.]
MKFGVLFSGGKDSVLALHMVAERGEHQVVCLITVVSKNKESFMFHTPNVDITGLQAQALGLPLISVGTEGCKELELVDLEGAILRAKVLYGIEGVVTGAVESVYQLSRIERVCEKLCLKCFSPLWRYDPRGLWGELFGRGFKVVVSGVFAYPLDVLWLGKVVDRVMFGRLLELSERYGVSVVGEGGEIETTVLDAPLFGQRVEVEDFELKWDGVSGVYVIKKASLRSK